MKFTLSWLKDHLKTDKTAAEIADVMTMAGLEVEGVHDPAESLSDFSVARIVKAEPHPDADRLQVCTVETKDGTKQIVCGAPNARAGLTGIYAPVGAYVAGIDLTLKKAKIRGVESHGMLCSARELELGDDHEGIIDLPGDHEVGQPAAEALAADPVIDFEVTPNRPDWLGVRGIARDLAAAGAGDLYRDTAAETPDSGFESPVGVTVEAPDACPVFLGRTIRGVKNGPSPDWLQQRLRAIGLRPINALVDITNYLSYDRARPLHVFDAAKLSGDVTARLGRKGETLEALDGKTYQLDEDMCVIADASGPVALGGVMGGEATGATDATTDVFVECAYFDPARTARTGRRTGIVSDARYRFERGVDTGFLTEGMELATAMIQQICGGEASHVIKAGEIPEGPRAIDFHLSEVRRLTGMDIPERRILEILEKLGCVPAGSGDHLAVQPPTWRRDLEQAADLVEEIARIEGFDRLEAAPLTRPAGRRDPIYSEAAERARRARRALAGEGWMEAVTWSFCNAAHAGLMSEGDPPQIANPVSSEMSVMRPTPLVNLVSALQWNADRGAPHAALFEVGPAWTGIGDDGQRRLAAGAVRAETVRHWAGNRTPDVFAAKAAALAALEAAGAPVTSLQTGTDMPAWWHPGRSGALMLGNKVLARFGEIHPRVLKLMDVDGRVLAFEVELDALPPARKKSKSKAALDKRDQTPLTRDFAFVKDADVPAEAVARAAAGADKALIERVDVFDLYQGAGLPEGKTSIAIAVRIAPKGEAMTEGEIEGLSKKIVAAVEKSTGATLRG